MLGLFTVASKGVALAWGVDTGVVVEQPLWVGEGGITTFNDDDDDDIFTQAIKFDLELCKWLAFVFKTLLWDVNEYDAAVTVVGAV